MPRFVFLCDGQHDDPGARRYGWRLVAANNRPLGRGMRADASLAASRAAAGRVHAAVAAGRPAVNVEVSRGRWTWQLHLEGVAAAMSVHTYLRRIECLRALDQFTRAVVAADPAAGVVRYFGPNSLHEYADVRGGATATSRALS